MSLRGTTHFARDIAKGTPLSLSSAGPGTAMEFALFLVEVLQGKEKRLEVEKPLILFPGMETKA